MAIKILLADDHMLIRQGIRKILAEEDDFQVVAEAADGQQALQCIRQHRPDVVLIDMYMPRLNGLQVMQQLAGEGLAVRFVFLTVEEADLLAVVESGAAGYLLKDIEAGMLVQAIRCVHQGQSFIHPKLTGKLVAALRDRDRKRGRLHDGIERLSEREVEVLQAVADGLSNLQIAGKLYLSEKTVKNHLTNIFRKLEVEDRTQAVVEGIRRGLIRIGAG
ncbi:MAG: response regulator transcription factor [Negativicutes bacterium]|nr:response regulator transcription factor [Negativicutes bacterium]